MTNNFSGYLRRAAICKCRNRFSRFPECHHHILPYHPFQYASSISPEPRVHNFIKSNLGSTEPIMNRKQINKLKTGCAFNSCHCLISLFSSITGIGREASPETFHVPLFLSLQYLQGSTINFVFIVIEWGSVFEFWFSALFRSQSLSAMSIPFRVIIFVNRCLYLSYYTNLHKWLRNKRWGFFFCSSFAGILRSLLKLQIVWRRRQPTFLMKEIIYSGYWETEWKYSLTE